MGNTLAAPTGVVLHIQCNNLIKEKSFTHPHRGTNIDINGYYTCQSSFVIKCPCGLLYVGETTQKVKNWLAWHKYSIRDKLVQLPLAGHFVEKGRTVAQPRFLVIDGITQNKWGGDRELSLKKQEVQ